MLNDAADGYPGLRAWRVRWEMCCYCDSWYRVTDEKSQGHEACPHCGKPPYVYPERETPRP